MEIEGEMTTQLFPKVGEYGIAYPLPSLSSLTVVHQDHTHTIRHWLIVFPT